jgi:hypothetical protein
VDTDGEPRPVRRVNERSVALAGTVLGIAAFRGLIDVLAHKLIPAPTAPSAA